MSGGPTCRAEQLWGAGLRALFPERSSGPVPYAVAPWPPRPQTRGRPAFDRSLVIGALRRPPHLTDVDPRHLHASQVGVTLEGVAYYLRDTYRRTGHTWADHRVLANQLPLIYRRADGRQVILGGHHRSTAALLAGSPVRALVVDERDPRVSDVGDAIDGGAAAVTPSVLIGSGATLGATPIASAGHGVAVITAGGTALTADPEVARAVLTGLEAVPDEADLRIARACAHQQSPQQRQRRWGPAVITTQPPTACQSGGTRAGMP